MVSSVAMLRRASCRFRERLDRRAAPHIHAMQFAVKPTVNVQQNRSGLGRCRNPIVRLDDQVALHVVLHYRTIPSTAATTRATHGLGAGCVALRSISRIAPLRPIVDTYFILAPCLL